MLLRKLQHILILAIILCVLFAARVQFLTGVPVSRDEARSAMRMMGTVSEIIAWQPPDWPPLHNIGLGLWASVAGEYPFSLRALSALTSMLGVSFAYFMSRYLTNDKRIAVGTMIIYGALGMSIYLSVLIRGYVIVYALLPLAILLTARYFEKAHKRDAFFLALTVGVMFLATYTAVIAFLFLGLYTILFHRKHLWRWIPPIIMASPFALVELLRKWDYWIGRISSSNPSGGYGYDFVQVFIERYADYFGHMGPFWITLIIVAVGLILWHSRQDLRWLIWVTAGCILAPVFTFWLVESRIFVIMTSRYSWWVLIFLAYGLSLGLRYLPDLIWFSVLLIVGSLMFTLPLGNQYYTTEIPPYHYESNMEWISQHIEPGDVLIIDPNFCVRECFEHDAKAYFWDVYLDDRLNQIFTIENQRRVWLWRGVGHSRELLDEISQGRVASDFFGPPESLLELYEAPPDPEGILFDNGMRFHGFDVIHDNGQYDYPPYDVRELGDMRIRLWWSTDVALDEDYTVSLQFHNSQNGELMVQDDGLPKLINLKPNAFEPLPKAPSQWIPEQLYVDEHIIHFPDLDREIFVDILLTVYQWWDGKRIAAPNVNSDSLLPLSQSIIWGWG